MKNFEFESPRILSIICKADNSLEEFRSRSVIPSCSMLFQEDIKYKLYYITYMEAK